MTALRVWLGKNDLSNIDEALKKEWLTTNGLGGYASSTILGVNTRKYHGLLVAALNPPGNRTVCLAKIDEEVDLDGKVYRAGANEFSDVFYPEGFHLLENFSLNPFPQYSYKFDRMKFIKKIFIPRFTNSVAVIYEFQNKTSSRATIRISPLVNCRHFHSVTNKENALIQFIQENGERSVKLDFKFQKAKLIIKASEGNFHERRNWIERLFYREEAARGESHIEDCYEPGFFEANLEPNSDLGLAILTEVLPISAKIHSLNVDFSSIKQLLDIEIQRQSTSMEFDHLASGFSNNSWLYWVQLAADSFVVKADDNKRSIIAGYHWFESWGRDSFISLPGLLLTNHRFEEARKVFLEFSKACTQGLIPNFVSDLSSAPSCNTVDATLWYINSVLQYLKYTADFDFVRDNLWEILMDILNHHIKGTIFDIHMDNDGLLSHGPGLTWMDAKIDGEAVTPRSGKAVEIQGLWYNTLRIMEILAAKFNEKKLSEYFSSLANKSRLAFNSKFWNEDSCCLYDVISEEGKDSCLRPNQIIVVSLDFNLLARNRCVEVVDLVQERLLTSCGLRTLDARDKRYKGTYSGNRRSRDEAYHNGTVWPWLIGPFITSFLKSKGYSLENSQYAFQNFINPLFGMQIAEGGLGTVNEVFDGDSPHNPGGCISQAWSIAEPLRAYIEDILRIRPKFELNSLVL
jgi:predicted glycogen debranching enzyme